MKKTWLVVAVIASLLFQAGAASAATAGEAKQSWLAAGKIRITADTTYRQAQLDYAADKTPENEQKVVDTAKTVLGAALDEAEAWLNWKKAESEEDTAVPESIRQNIANDVAKNLAKINGLREEVSGIETRLEAGTVFLKMLGAYVELLVDVARNTGAAWAYVGNQRVQLAADYEAKLRETAEKLNDNAEIIAKLDIAKAEISVAKSKIKTAEAAYKKVVLPGTPLIKFSEGNNYLRQARENLINAQLQLARAFDLIISEK
jgi:hypothetical protein